MTFRFEWDESKRKLNLRRHGIDFCDVPQVFEGKTLTYEDERFPYHEQRFITIGLLRGIVVLVAHTESSESIRIIHVRKASKKTSARYIASFRD